MTRVHIADNYLLNPRHPISVNLIGAGGTGSQVLTGLARIDATLKTLEHPGLFVTVYDPDTVQEPNKGRQLFSDSDMELNKAVCLVTRVNHFFGNNWKAVQNLYVPGNDLLANITITCTDNIKSRTDFWDVMSNYSERNDVNFHTPLYWMDFGNTQSKGQVVLGTLRKATKAPESKKYTVVSTLKNAPELFDFSQMTDDDSGPSCSLAEALKKQDLFINSILAQFGCDLLWKLIREGMIQYHGLYLNLETLRTNPIAI